MKDKVLVKLYVPAVENQFDVWIPNNRAVYEVIQLLVEGIKEFSDGQYNPVNMPLLYDKKLAKPYDIKILVKDSNISNASEVILI